MRSAMTDLVVYDNNEASYESGDAGIVEGSVDPSAALLLTRCMGWLQD